MKTTLKVLMVLAAGMIASQAYAGTTRFDDRANITYPQTQNGGVSSQTASNPDYNFASTPQDRNAMRDTEYWAKARYPKGDAAPSMHGYPNEHPFYRNQ